MKRNLVFSLISLYFLSLVNAQDQCAPVGWAAYNYKLTGGGTCTPVLVTTIEELIAQAKENSPKVIYVSGTMGNGSGEGGSRVDVSSDKTIIGMPGATVKAYFSLKKCNNVIIRNLIFQGPGSVDVNGQDNMTLETATRVWIDHCDFRDGQDGNLDFKKQCNYISVTWCKFSYTSASSNHQFSNLIGNSDTYTDDRGYLKITFQYNWWSSGIVERMPRIRFGQVHLVNNLFTSSEGKYCVRAGIEADILVESNAFIAVKNPVDIDHALAKVTCRNNLTTGSTGTMSGQGTSFSPPYALNIAPATEVQSLVSNASSGAGATMDSPGECK